MHGTFKRDPFENADLYRELAVRRRANGLATGKSAAGWDTKRQYDPDTKPAKGSWERLRVESRIGWQDIRDREIETFALIASGVDFENFIPF